MPSFPGNGLPTGSVNLPPVNVLACGADPTGVSDSYAAFQTAANIGFVFGPPGSYRLSQPVIFPNTVPGAGFSGAGPGATNVLADFTTGDVFQFAGSSLTLSRFDNFSLSRVHKCDFTASISGTVLTVTAVSQGAIAVGDFVVSPPTSVPPPVLAGTKILSVGPVVGGNPTYNLTSPLGNQTVGSIGMYTYRVTSGSGLNMSGSCDKPLIFNVEFLNQWVGLQLGNVGIGNVAKSWFHNCASDGLNINDTVASQVQWQLDDLWSQCNGGMGYNISSTTAGSAGGQWRGLKSGSNVGRGFSATNISQLSLANCFFGSDGGDEIYVTGGNSFYNATFSSVRVEQSGSGHGFNFDTGFLGGATLLGCTAIDNNKAGTLWNNTGLLTVSGGNFDLNGINAPATYSGILLLQGTGRFYGSQALVSGGGTSNNGLIISAGCVAYGDGNHFQTIFNGGTNHMTNTF